MKSKLFSFIILFIGITIVSCKAKSLNSSFYKIEINETKPLSKVLKKNYEKVMILSKNDREKIIDQNCKKICYLQDYESWDFVILCTDSKQNGFVYVVNPFFGWLDSIEIESEVQENTFYEFQDVYIIKRNSRKYVIGAKEGYKF